MKSPRFWSRYPFPCLGGSRWSPSSPVGAVWSFFRPPCTRAMAAIEPNSQDDQAAPGKAFGPAGLVWWALGAGPAAAGPSASTQRALPGDGTVLPNGPPTRVAGAPDDVDAGPVQVNLDAGRKPRWADRVRLAHAPSGPFMVAIARQFSPAAERKIHPAWRSSRQRVLGVSSSSARCGPTPRQRPEDPGTDWARPTRLKAPVIAGLHSPRKRWPVHPRSRCRFADWARTARSLLGGRRPTRYDWNPPDSHCSLQLRPRKCWRSATWDACPSESRGPARWSAWDQ